MTQPVASTPTPPAQAAADIGVIGLAVMGENLILNLVGRGYTVAVFNRTVEKVTAFTQGRGQSPQVVGTGTLEALIANLAQPRKLLLMVRAGQAVDDLIGQLRPLLEPGDILVDGGNSHPDDTTRRVRELAAAGIHFVGSGISGGEEGALHGPSIMPGGSEAAWADLKPILQDISARADDGAPCCEWMGPEGAGHFVKMVHNGIEYADMQLIAESYQLLRDVAGLNAAETAGVFADWNRGELNSYLIEITADILTHTDDATGQPLVELILDAAGQKGTGKWTSVAALDHGVPTMTITQAVYARGLSALKDERVAASQRLSGPQAQGALSDRAAFVEQVRQALYASKVAAYAQGFGLLRLAAQERQWALDLGRVARIWRSGCIIRADFLDDITAAYHAQPELPNLLLAPGFQEALGTHQQAWRQVVATAALRGVPVPALGSALAYYDSYRTARLPANLIQAQRDYFGAHTYERTDRPRGEFHHTDWTGHGGSTASTTYSV